MIEIAPSSLAMSDLETEAAEYAQEAYKEITADPFAFGVSEPWRTVEEWVEFEMDGGASDEFRGDKRRAAIWNALQSVASLEDLNRPFLPVLADRILTAQSLSSLLAHLRKFEDTAGRDDTEGTLKSYGVDICELPTLGGEQPKSTADVWSWDADSLLMGTGSFKEWEIVDRDDND